MTAAACLQEAFHQLDKDGDGHLTPGELRNAQSSTGSLSKSGLAAEIDQAALEGLIAASDLYGEGYIDVDEFLAAMLANSNYAKTKDAVRMNSPVRLSGIAGPYAALADSCAACGDMASCCLFALSPAAAGCDVKWITDFVGPFRWQNQTVAIFLRCEAGHLRLL